jgi:hypothetical protein
MNKLKASTLGPSPESGAGLETKQIEFVFCVTKYETKRVVGLGSVS